LTRHFAGLEHELAPAPIELNTMDIEHCICLSWFSRSRKPWARWLEAASRAECGRVQRLAILPWPRVLR
jgi:hypothetical protein